jgi:signal transduction histidine kinase
MLRDRADLVGKLFVSNISRPFLEGRDEEVDRACRLLGRGSLIARVQVLRPDGYVVCDFSDSSRALSTRWSVEKKFQIHFSSESAVEAGTVAIQFDQSELIQRIRMYLVLAAIFAILFFAASQVFFRRVIAAIVQPVARLIEILKTRSVEEIGFDGVVGSSRIAELNSLSNQFQAFAKRLVIYQRKALQREHSLAASSMARQTAHDIRSPLSVLNILSKRLKFSNEDEAQLFRSAVLRVSQIADGLLDQTRGLELEAVAVPGPEKVLWSELSQQLSLLIDEKRIEFPDLNMDLNSSVPATTAILANAVQLKSVLSNLVNNSAEANASSVILRSYLDAQEFVLEVEDDGTGFSAEALRAIGRKEFTEGKVKGNGMGLSVTARLILDWGGDVDFANTDDGGALIRLRLRTT